MTRIFFLLLTCFLALPASAQDRSDSFEFGGDAFIAGRNVSHDTADTDDLFMAGERVTGRVDITGSVHMAGREITMQGAVGGDAYVAGEEIVMGGAIAGDATLVGRAVSVDAVGGDLRIAGSELEIKGDVAGYAMVAGETVSLRGTIAGDLSLAAKDVDWGEDARVTGRVILYEDDPGKLSVPENVAPADRIERREVDDWEGPRPPSVRRAIAGFLTGVLVVTGLAALIAALVPERLAALRRQILARPFWSLWLGFLTQSAIVGAAILLGLTLIGLLLTPAMIFLALAAGFVGYVVAAYAFGVFLVMTFGAAEPDSIGDRAIAAGAGALAAGIIGLVPFFGWLFVLALVLVGIGALTLWLLRPAFFVAAG